MTAIRLRGAAVLALLTLAAGPAAAAFSLPEEVKEEAQLVCSTGTAGAIAFSPGGSLIAAVAAAESSTSPARALADSLVCVWTASAGKLVWQKRIPGRPYEQIAFRPGYDEILLGDSGGDMLVLNSDDGAEKRRLAIKAPFWVHPSGSYAAALDPGGILLYELEGGALASRFDTGKPAKVLGIAFSTEGSVLAAACDDALRYWNISPSSAAPPVPFDSEREGGRPTGAIAFTHPLVLEMGFETGWVTEFDFGARRPARRDVFEGGEVSRIQVMGRSRLVLYASLRKIAVQSLERQYRLKPFEPFASRIEDVVLSPSAKRLAAQDEQGRIHLLSFTLPFDPEPNSVP